MTATAALVPPTVTMPDGQLGHLFTPYADAMPGDVAVFDRSRLLLRLSSADLDAVGRLPRRGQGAVVVTDLLTGRRFDAVRAECGAGCECAALVTLARECTALSGHLPGMDHRWQECPTYHDDDD